MSSGKRSSPADTAKKSRVSPSADATEGDGLGGLSKGKSSSKVSGRKGVGVPAKSKGLIPAAGRKPLFSKDNTIYDEWMAGGPTNSDDKDSERARKHKADEAILDCDARNWAKARDRTSLCTTGQDLYRAILRLTADSNVAFGKECTLDRAVQHLQSVGKLDRGIDDWEFCTLDMKELSAF
ncbi:hypothetical protein B484DRAFT_398756 [Ochromonadaceae sp. CCMP2298]|nr:hypothetical protein B484DRAFT_398756 [Ochromonadaceae sp. CCMP2298]